MPAHEVLHSTQLEITKAFLMDCRKCATANTAHAKFCTSFVIGLQPSGSVPAFFQSEQTFSKCKASNALTAKFFKACSGPFSQAANLSPVKDSEAEATVYFPFPAAVNTPFLASAAARPSISEPEPITTVRPVSATALDGRCRDHVSRGVPAALRDPTYPSAPLLSAPPARLISSPASLPPKLAPTPESTKTAASNKVMVLGGPCCTAFRCDRRGGLLVFQRRGNSGRSSSKHAVCDARQKYSNYGFGIYDSEIPNALI